ncbi:MAG: LytR C-terminal domain-containing protein [Thermoleophilia bacterium]|nr:LytR C-terminal domain-containing protein [Thermoleophilia bacterium]
MSDGRVPDTPGARRRGSIEPKAGGSSPPKTGVPAEPKAAPTPEELELYQALANTESPAQPPNPLGYRSRSERRTYRRAERRRKSHAKLWLVVAPVLVVIAAIVALLTLLGGPETDTRPTTTVAPAKVYAGGLLAVEDQDDVPLVLLLQAREGGGLVLALPGLTLLNTPSDGFKILAELCKTGEDGDLGMVVGDALGVRPAAVASVAWSELRGALAAAGVKDLPSEALTSAEDENEQLARAVLASLGGSESGANALWDGLPLDGDSSGLRKAVAEMAASVAGGEWTAAELGGRLVESTGGRYLEPDVKHAKALLDGTWDDLEFTVQVQNGSGVVGIAEQTVELLEAMGYTMLPVGNAQGFPDVKQTRITASPDAAAEARRVRNFLGVGTVSEDATLEQGHMIVVLGKDYVPPTTTTEPAG